MQIKIKLILDILITKQQASNSLKKGSMVSIRTISRPVKFLQNNKSFLLEIHINVVAFLNINFALL